MAEKREKLSKFDRQRLELQKLQQRIRADTERAKQLEISSRQTGQNDLWNKAKKTGLTIDQVFDYIDKLAALVSHRMTRPEFDDFLLELQPAAERIGFHLLALGRKLRHLLHFVQRIEYPAELLRLVLKFLYRTLQILALLEKHRVISEYKHGSGVIL